MSAARFASFSSVLCGLYAAGLAAALAELAVAWTRAPAGALSFARACVAFGGLQLFVFSVAAVLALACVGLSAVRRASRASSDPELAQRASLADRGAAGLLIAPPALALGAFAILHLVRHFRNQELAALVAAALVSVIALSTFFTSQMLAIVLHALRTRLARRGTRLGGVIFAPGALGLGALVWLDAHTRWSGANQLDPWLLAPPIAACAGPFALRTAARSSHGTARVARRLVAPLALGLGMLALIAPAPAAAELASYGPWSRWIVPVLRSLSDVDGDGYSAWFGGGDCAGFDRDVHPGASEIAENGVDDNCVGGDGKRGVPVEPPRPSGVRVLEPNARANLVLVTIETLRSDHVSFLGYSRPTTPRLADISRSAVVFERLYASTPTTRLSLPALLSGTYPSRLDWRRQTPDKRMRRVGPRTPWLPLLLREQGYVTIAVHASFRAFTELESAGFDRGFDHYDVATTLAYSGGTMHGFPGNEQIDRALALLSKTGARPFLLWVHLLEPHYLYQQPPLAPRFGTAERDLYDAEIAEADRQVGRLWDGLEARGLLANSILLVTGDHGEEFGEHGERWHTSNLYEPQLRTAGLIRVPGLGARRLRTPVALTDLAPTVLDLLGMPAGLARMQGRNLVPLLSQGDRALPRFFLENFRVDTGTGYQLAVLSWPYKLIYREEGGLLELYDVARDPAERENLYVKNEAVAQELLGELFRFRESRAGHAAE